MYDKTNYKITGFLICVDFQNDSHLGNCTRILLASLSVIKGCECSV